MALEKPIIKASMAGAQSFDYKPREFSMDTTAEARSFADEDSFRSKDFKISDLVAQQAGISQLASDAHQDQINTLVLERLKEIQQKAYDEGYQLGLIEGTEKAFQESKVDLSDKMLAMQSLLSRIEQMKGQLLIDHEAELIRLVFLIAKKIALRDLEGHREAALEILKGVIGEAQADEQIVVRLSNEDLYFIETLKDKTAQRFEFLQHVKLVGEDTIKPGGCMIESQYGTVDATIDERVERTWQTLLSRIPQHPPESKE
jgi:flagellar assembly protein FliH